MLRKKSNEHGSSDGMRELEELEVMSKGDVLEFTGTSEVEQFWGMTESRMWPSDEFLQWNQSH